MLCHIYFSIKYILFASCICVETKDSLLVCYGEEHNTNRRQILYNESKVFTRDGFPEMGSFIYNDGWTELISSSTSLPTMYIHVTSEEKDGETVYKSDKTYEEIKEAIDSGKSPVVVYNNVLFNSYGDGDPTLYFISDKGIIAIDNNDFIVFMEKLTILPLSIAVQDTGEAVIDCKQKM